jgi:hypothetical protein
MKLIDETKPKKISENQMKRKAKDYFNSLVDAKILNSFEIVSVDKENKTVNLYVNLMCPTDDVVEVDFELKNF